MKRLTDSTLSVIDHASPKLSPPSTLLDKLVEKVVPTVTAAACPGALCSEPCTNFRRSHFMVGYRYYSPNPAGCLGHFYTCKVTFCAC